MSLGARQYRELAECVGAAALEYKQGDGPRFVRPWRMVDRSGRETKELISCSAGECGCGISPDLK